MNPLWTPKPAVLWSPTAMMLHRRSMSGAGASSAPFRSVTTATFATGFPWSCQIPSTTQPGDQLLAVAICFTTTDQGGQSPPPTGWTRVLHTIGGQGIPGSFVAFNRTAIAGDAGSTISGTWNNLVSAPTSALVLVADYGPTGSYGTQSGVPGNSTSATDVVTLTPRFFPATGIYTFASYVSGAAIASPGGLTQRANFTTASLALGLGDILVSSGSLPLETAAVTNGAWLAAQFFINPVGH